MILKKSDNINFAFFICYWSDRTRFFKLIFAKKFDKTLGGKLLWQERMPLMYKALFVFLFSEFNFMRT